MNEINFILNPVEETGLNAMSSVNKNPNINVYGESFIDHSNEDSKCCDLLLKDNSQTGLFFQSQYLNNNAVTDLHMAHGSKLIVNSNDDLPMQFSPRISKLDFTSGNDEHNFVDNSVVNRNMYQNQKIKIEKSYLVPEAGVLHDLNVQCGSKTAQNINVPLISDITGKTNSFEEILTYPLQSSMDVSQKYQNSSKMTTTIDCSDSGTTSCNINEVKNVSIEKINGDLRKHHQNTEIRSVFDKSSMLKSDILEKSQQKPPYISNITQKMNHSLQKNATYLSLFELYKKKHSEWDLLLKQKNLKQLPIVVLKPYKTRKSVALERLMTSKSTEDNESKCDSSTFHGGINKPKKGLSEAFDGEQVDRVLNQVHHTNSLQWENNHASTSNAVEMNPPETGEVKLTSKNKVQEPTYHKQKFNVSSDPPSMSEVNTQIENQLEIEPVPLNNYEGVNINDRYSEFNLLGLSEAFDGKQDDRVLNQVHCTNSLQWENNHASTSHAVEMNPPVETSVVKLTSKNKVQNRTCRKQKFKVSSDPPSTSEVNTQIQNQLEIELVALNNYEAVNINDRYSEVNLLGLSEAFDGKQDDRVLNQVHCTNSLQWENNHASTSHALEMNPPVETGVVKLTCENKVQEPTCHKQKCKVSSDAPSTSEVNTQMQNQLEIELVPLNNYEAVNINDRYSEFNLLGLSETFDGKQDDRVLNQVHCTNSLQWENDHASTSRAVEMNPPETGEVKLTSKNKVQKRTCRKQKFKVSSDPPSTSEVNTQIQNQLEIELEPLNNYEVVNINDHYSEVNLLGLSETFDGEQDDRVLNQVHDTNSLQWENNHASTSNAVEMNPPVETGAVKLTSKNKVQKRTCRRRKFKVSSDTPSTSEVNTQIQNQLEIELVPLNNYEAVNINDRYSEVNLLGLSEAFDGKQDDRVLNQVHHINSLPWENDHASTSHPVEMNPSVETGVVKLTCENKVQEPTCHKQKFKVSSDAPSTSEVNTQIENQLEIELVPLNNYEAVNINDRYSEVNLLGLSETFDGEQDDRVLNQVHHTNSLQWENYHAPTSHAVEMNPSVETGVVKLTCENKVQEPTCHKQKFKVSSDAPSTSEVNTQIQNQLEIELVPLNNYEVVNINDRYSEVNLLGLSETFDGEQDDRVLNQVHDTNSLQWENNHASTSNAVEMNPPVETGAVKVTSKNKVQKRTCRKRKFKVSSDAPSTSEVNTQIQNQLEIELEPLNNYEVVNINDRYSEVNLLGLSETFDGEQDDRVLNQVHDTNSLQWENNHASTSNAVEMNPPVETGAVKVTSKNKVQKRTCRKRKFKVSSDAPSTSEVNTQIQNQLEIELEPLNNYEVVNINDRYSEVNLLGLSETFDGEQDDRVLNQVHDTNSLQWENNHASTSNAVEMNPPVETGAVKVTSKNKVQKRTCRKRKFKVSSDPPSTSEVNTQIQNQLEIEPVPLNNYEAVNINDRYSEVNLLGLSETFDGEQDDRVLNQVHDTNSLQWENNHASTSNAVEMNPPVETGAVKLTSKNKVQKRTCRKRKFKVSSDPPSTSEVNTQIQNQLEIEPVPLNNYEVVNINDRYSEVNLLGLSETFDGEQDDRVLNQVHDTNSLQWENNHASTSNAVEMNPPVETGAVKVTSKNKVQKRTCRKRKFKVSSDPPSTSEVNTQIQNQLEIEPVPLNNYEVVNINDRYSEVNLLGLSETFDGEQDDRVLNQVHHTNSLQWENNHASTSNAVEMNPPVETGAVKVTSKNKVQKRTCRKRKFKVSSDPPSTSEVNTQIQNQLEIEPVPLNKYEAVNINDRYSEVNLLGLSETFDGEQDDTVLNQVHHTNSLQWENNHASTSNAVEMNPPVETGAVKVTSKNKVQKRTCRKQKVKVSSDPPSTSEVNAQIQNQLEIEPVPLNNYEAVNINDHYSEVNLLGLSETFDGEQDDRVLNQVHHTNSLQWENNHASTSNAVEMNPPVETGAVKVTSKNKVQKRTCRKRKFKVSSDPPSTSEVNTQIQNQLEIEPVPLNNYEAVNINDHYSEVNLLGLSETFDGEQDDRVLNQVHHTNSLQWENNHASTSNAVEMNPPVETGAVKVTSKNKVQKRTCRKRKFKVSSDPPSTSEVNTQIQNQLEIEPVPLNKYEAVNINDRYSEVNLLGLSETFDGEQDDRVLNQVHDTNSLQWENNHASTSNAVEMNPPVETGAVKVTSKNKVQKRTCRKRKFKVSSDAPSTSEVNTQIQNQLEIEPVPLNKYEAVNINDRYSEVNLLGLSETFDGEQNDRVLNQVHHKNSLQWENNHASTSNAVEMNPPVETGAVKLTSKNKVQKRTCRKRKCKVSSDPPSTSEVNTQIQNQLEIEPVPLNNYEVVDRYSDFKLPEINKIFDKKLRPKKRSVSSIKKSCQPCASHVTTSIKTVATNELKNETSLYRKDIQEASVEEKNLVSTNKNLSGIPQYESALVHNSKGDSAKIPVAETNFPKCTICMRIFKNSRSLAVHAKRCNIGKSGIISKPCAETNITTGMKIAAFITSTTSSVTNSAMLTFATIATTAGEDSILTSPIASTTSIMGTASPAAVISNTNVVVNLKSNEKLIVSPLLAVSNRIDDKINTRNRKRKLKTVEELPSKKTFKEKVPVKRLRSSNKKQRVNRSLSSVNKE